MITILHGDNYISSRKSLNEIKNAKKLDAQRISLEDLTQTLESNSLFVQKDKQSVIIENLLTLPQSKNKKNLIEIVIRSQEKPIYLWEKKTITSAVKKLFPKAKIQEFKAPKLVFKFLDSLNHQNQKQTLFFLHQTIKTEPIELVFYFLHRRVSQLIQALDNPKTLKGSPWQLDKIKTQAKQFTLKELLALHQKLLNIDYQIKIGQSILPLTSQLDLLFLNI